MYLVNYSYNQSCENEHDNPFLVMSNFRKGLKKNPKRKYLIMGIRNLLNCSTRFLFSGFKQLSV